MNFFEIVYNTFHSASYYFYLISKVYSKNANHQTQNAINTMFIKFMGSKYFHSNVNN